MSMLFKSMTTKLICFLYPLILTSSSTYHITSSFLVLSILKTLNDLAIGFVLILSSFTSCLSILVWVHSEFTSICNCNSFPFYVLILVCTFSSLSLSFFWFGIIYWFWTLDIEVSCTMPTLELYQNSSDYYLSHYLFLPRCCGSSSSILFCNLWQYVLLCHTYNPFWYLILSLAFCISLPYVHIHYNWSI